MLRSEVRCGKRSRRTMEGAAQPRGLPTGAENGSLAPGQRNGDFDGIDRGPLLSLDGRALEDLTGSRLGLQPSGRRDQDRNRDHQMPLR